MSLINRTISSDKYDIKCPYTMIPVGIAIHNTANDASAANEVAYMQGNNNEVSFHIAIDDKEAILALPLNRNCWACGDGGNGQGNRRYISVEICYSLSGGDRFTDAEQRAIDEVVLLCKQLGFTADNIKAHRDFSGKNCPHRTDIDWFREEVRKGLNSSLKDVEQVFKVNDYRVKNKPCIALENQYVYDNATSKPLIVNGRELIIRTGQSMKMWKVINNDRIEVCEGNNGGYVLRNRIAIPVLYGDKPTPPKPVEPPKPIGKIYRVIVDGKQIGAYSSQENALNTVKSNMGKNIEITYK